MLIKLSKKQTTFEASKDIAEFSRLETLEISAKHTCHIIIDCGELSALKKLYIYADGALGQCLLTLKSAQNLEVLKLKGISGSHELRAGHLKNLKILQLANCNLNTIPNWCCEQRKLESLELQNNLLESLPNEFEWLTGLRRLNIDNNLFQEVPRVLANLEKLNHLSCDRNRITDENLFNFKKLKNS
ncbi:leucine rich repeat protein [Bacteriovorax sp. BAL6_X]|uniref:leucine-rich repeat domain-containing protein n=1 Tax=Bacteriovorax sp. BAL6_X TaxID=1201290 RepID=UPI0003863CDA|nr:leucine-rich repeat domain-containing protein [Bacteriovorax sp. BAL6_X]EPZ50814.1 leucine rich repeat protein [Bacteriovorax sp. BAL6_X]